MQSDYRINTSSIIQLAESQRTGQPDTSDLWETALLLGFPAALWRLPNQQDKHLIVSFEEVLPRVSADLDELPAGFLISPFDNLAKNAPVEAQLSEHLDQTGIVPQTLFLRADIQATFLEPGAHTAKQIEIKNTAGTTADRFWDTVDVRSKTKRSQPITSESPTPILDPGAQALYEENVVKAIEAIQRGELRKVVLSRTKQMQFVDVPNAVKLFDKLCQKYPSAFVSAVSIPERGQIWISATPERLVSMNANGVFQTTSLAGTQSAFHADGTAKHPAQAMWSQKEIEEQALVSRYIIECFKKIRLREYVEEGPKSIIAGNLMHLGTSFTVDTQAVRYPQLGTVMLRLLHPTSAVCGTPRDAAFNFIRQHERHDRELYSGFLGPVNIDANNEGPTSSIFVHIRCMKLEGRLATLYAGAGITENSEPEREWQETEMKCQTLLKVMMNDE
ncbi:isochorismate synthase [Spirosoma sp. HMF4905]|uniref:isochorismate synthase n=1 Tax=Spirosoma arboris TaxID=2682092 RepID=A0A7K1SLD4_9BACT|nr:chorismate-binding protein [Spirosoma arboris]MVM34619.1 isochorismate synthase [Spirosoma arboris]